MKIPTLMQADDRSWTRWTTPAVNYKLVCCDCGLCHDVEFMVRLKGGKKLDRRRGQIKFRLRRNLRSTAAIRRHPQKASLPLFAS